MRDVHGLQRPRRGEDKTNRSGDEERKRGAEQSRRSVRDSVLHAKNYDRYRRTERLSRAPMAELD